MQRCIGGSNQDFACNIIQTYDGGYIFIGGTSSNDGDVNCSLHGNGDVWVVKTDASFNIQWQRCFGGSSYEQIYGNNLIVQADDGGYFFAATTTSNDGDVSGYHDTIYYDIWVVRIDPSGNILWQKCLGGSSNDQPFSIAKANNGGIIICGTTASNNGNVSGLHGVNDCWIVKLSDTGIIEWQKCYGGSLPDNGTSISKTNDGGYIFCGAVKSNNYDVTNNHLEWVWDVWLVKIDSIGNLIWQKCYGGSSNDAGYVVRQTNDNGYIIGAVTASNDGDVVGHHGAPGNGNDFWLIKVDSLGNILWQKCYGGYSSDDLISLEITNDGGYIATGRTSSHDGDVEGNHSISNFSDIWIIKVDFLGNILWKKCLGGSDYEIAYSGIVTTDYGFVISGYTRSVDGDILYNQGLDDAWLIKLLNSNISGQVFIDLNENGIKDSLEQGVSGHLVRMNPGNHYTFTNNDGYYYFRGDTGLTNTVKYVAQNYWYETTNNYYHYVTLDSLSHVVDTLDYAVKSRVNINDVSVYIPGSLTRANFETHYWLTYKNWGTVTASGTIEFHYDPLLTYNASTPLAPVSHVGNTLTFAYDTLGPGAQRILRVDFQIPGVQNLGDTLHLYAMITPLVPDTFVTNNYDTLQQVITGSYDPNDKTVSPAGYGQWGFVEHGQRLTYIIRFQNTGTDTAFTVVIRDTLDSDLDIETFVVEAYSHPVTWQLHSGNELFFTFQNIMLPDSNVNEPESHGFIRYSISPKQGLADGTTATNTSYIFFDYNPAVVTNTTLNTFVTNIPVAKPILEILKTLAFPNPSNDVVYINLPEFTRKVEVYNNAGLLVQQLVPQKQVAEINVKELPMGVYIVKIYCGKGIITTRFVKE